MYDFLIGPMLAFSLVVFAGGLVFRIHRFFALSREHDANLAPLPFDIVRMVEAREGNDYIRVNSAADILLRWKVRLKRTFPGRHPLFFLITVVFHAIILFLPFFVQGHNVLLDDYFNFRLPAFSESVTDKLTMIFILLFVFFLFRRALVSRVRAITTYRDYIALLAAGAPFVTGFLTFHQVFDYNTVLCIHIVCGELMLIAIPFTKLAHMPFFVLSRFLIRSELCFGPGTRKWIETAGIRNKGQIHESG